MAKKRSAAPDISRHLPRGMTADGLSDDQKERVMRVIASRQTVLKTLDYSEISPHEIVGVIVENPYDQGKYIPATISLRDDPLKRLHVKGQIDDAQLAAGRAWQRDHENSEIGGVRAMQLKDPVDGSPQYPEPITDRHRQAVLRLTAADRALGLFGGQIVRMVLVDRLSMADIGVKLGYSTAREVNFLSKRFRECLDTLAVEIYHLASRSKVSV